jgi:Icc-related predicted phosphoesterase
VLDFLDWFAAIPIPKIFVAGNHDISIERGLVARKDIAGRGIYYLENSAIEWGGLSFWGSPYTPSFGKGWAWNCPRHKLHKLWATIPNVDVIITHGPPKGILDLSRNPDNTLEQCGCKALLTRIGQLNPKLCLFGHIHNSKGITNSAVFRMSDVIYSNGSCITDGGKLELTSHGNIIGASVH